MKTNYRETRRKWRLANPDKEKEYRKRHYEKHKEQLRIVAKAYHVKTKLVVLGYYSNGELKCARCGESRLPCLSIDHISGGGLKHRRSIGINSGGGSTFYRWLRNNCFPEGYQVLCMNCQYIKRNENKEDYIGRA